MEDNKDTIEYTPENITPQEPEERGFVIIDVDESEQNTQPEEMSPEDDLNQYVPQDEPEKAPEAEPVNEFTFDAAEESPAPEEPASEDPSAITFVESYGPKDKKKKKKKQKDGNGKNGRIALIIIAIVLLSALSGFAGSFIYDQVTGGSGGNSISRTDGYTLEDSTGSSMTVAEIVEKTADSVVEITTESTSTDSWMTQYVTEGAGSGVIIDSEKGYIMTNNHVVEDSNKITVTLRNEKQYDAEVVGVDSVNDVAVIKIDTNDELTAATYGNSDQLKVGELAVAIGNPLGELGGTVSSGIISALDRTINVDGQDMTLLQTDASINPGNSGGGLFNDDGQLIGLVVAKSSGSDVEGLGFAIPINTAAEVAQQIIKAGGNITSSSGDAMIGVNLLELTTKEEAAQYGFDSTGLYIAQISSNNAQQAGLQIGDRIVKADGKKISEFDDLSAVLDEHSPGDKISITVERDGKKVELETELVDESQVYSDNSSSQQQDQQQQDQQQQDDSYNWEDMIP